MKTALSADNEIIRRHINTIIRDGMRSIAAQECLKNRITKRQLSNESEDYLALVAVNGDIVRASAQLGAVQALASDMIGAEAVEEIVAAANVMWKAPRQHLINGITVCGVEIDIRDLP